MAELFKSMYEIVNLYIYMYIYKTSFRFKLVLLNLASNLTTAYFRFYITSISSNL